MKFEQLLATLKKTAVANHAKRVAGLAYATAIKPDVVVTDRGLFIKEQITFAKSHGQYFINIIFDMIDSFREELEKNSVKLVDHYQECYIENLNSVLFPGSNGEIDTKLLWSSISRWLLTDIPAWINSGQKDPAPSLNKQEFKKNFLSYFLAPIVKYGLAEERTDLPTQVVLRRLDNVAKILASDLSVCVAVTYHPFVRTLIVASNAKPLAKDATAKASELTEMRLKIKRRINLINTWCSEFANLYGRTITQKSERHERHSAILGFLNGGKAQLKFIQANEPREDTEHNVILLSEANKVFKIEFYNRERVCQEREITCPEILAILNQGPLNSKLNNSLLIDFINQQVTSSGGCYLLEPPNRIAEMMRGGLAITDENNNHTEARKVLVEKVATIVDFFLFSAHLLDPTFDRQFALENCIIILPDNRINLLKQYSDSKNAPFATIDHEFGTIHAEQLLMLFFKAYDLEIKLIGLNKLLCETCWRVVQEHFPNALVSGTSHVSFKNVIDVFTGVATQDELRHVKPHMERAPSDLYSPRNGLEEMSPPRTLQNNSTVASSTTTNSPNHQHVHCRLKHCIDSLQAMMDEKEEAAEVGAAAAAFCR